jgi:hypothetical protein
VCEAMPAEAQTRFPGIAFVQVNDGRAALAELAAAFYGDPDAGSRPGRRPQARRPRVTGSDLHPAGATLWLRRNRLRGSHFCLSSASRP